MENSTSSCGYAKEHYERIGQRGNWQSLGLPSLRDIVSDPKTTKTKINEAYRRLRAGEMVTNPFGEQLHVDKRTLKHLAKRGRDQTELLQRLSEMDAAEETVRSPHEIWVSDQLHRRVYIRITLMANGHKVINAVDENDFVLSWHSNAERYDYWRRGILVYIRP